MMAIWIDHRLGELRYAVRMIRKTPTVSAIAVLSLALGIGANTAIFSLVDTLLLKLLPVRAPHELQQVARQFPERQVVGWNYPDYRAFRDRTRAFTGLAAYSGPQAMGLQAADSPGDASELAYVSLVSGNFFGVLGVDAAAGRLLNGEDDRQLGAAPYAVLGYDYWQRRFAGDFRVVDRTVRLNGYPFTIVGVARRGFRGLDVSTSANLFIPIAMHSETAGVPATIWNTRHYWWIQVVGRLAPTATVAQAQAQLSLVYRDQEATEGRVRRDAGPGATPALALLPAAHGWSGARNTLEKPLIVLMVVVALVLLIACANLAGLMLARGAARQREIAVRLAVGASRTRLTGQLLAESVLLSLLGGVAGLAFAYVCVQILLGFVPQSGRSLADIRVSLDVRLLAFTFGVSLLTAVVFGLAPALRSTRPDLVPVLKDDRRLHGRRRFTLRKTLVIGQMALSLLLLVGAGLFVRTLQNLRDVDLGFRRDRTFFVSVDPSRNGYKGQRLRDFYERLRAGVEHVPGVQSVSLATITPLGGMQWNGDFRPEGHTFKAGEPRDAEFNTVGPRYFETVGIPILLGRDFRDEDSPSSSPDPPTQLLGGPDRDAPAPGPRVAIVTESLAKRFFAGRNPVGMHVCLGAEYDPSRASEIVGVVRDAQYFGLREAAEPMIYLPVWRPGPEPKVLCVRTPRQNVSIVETVRRQVTAIDAAIPVLASRSIEQRIDDDIVVERLVATLATFFGLLALLLAGIGLYGVISYTVSGRTREIGIRIALGATRSSVLSMVLREAALLVVAGAAVAVALAFFLTRLLKVFLYGVSAQDPLTLAASLSVLMLVAATASLVPARRATRIEPTTALRCE